MRLLRRGAPPSTLDLLVAGLGNPGREYTRTRHNLGHMVSDELVRRHGGSYRAKFSGDLAELRLDGSRVALLKPQTYMNESGKSVGAAVRFFKVPPEQLLVVHDEVDLDVGRLQVRQGGGLAGRVLTPFPAEVDVDAIVARAADAVATVAGEGLEEAQQRFNERP